MNLIYAKYRGLVEEYATEWSAEREVWLCDLLWETNNVHTKGTHSQEDEGTLMGGCRSISNDDAIDWLRHPVVLFISQLFVIIVFPFFNCSVDVERTGSESWSPSPTRKDVHQAANPGMKTSQQNKTAVSVVFFTAERDVVLQPWRVTLAHNLLFFAAFLRRDCFEAAWSIPPQLFDSRWLGARSAHLPAGSQLPCFCGEGGGRAEETAGGVRNLRQQPRAAKPSQPPSFIYFTSTFLVGSVPERVFCHCSVQCCATVWNCSAAGGRNLINAVCFQSFYSEKKNIALTPAFERSYVLRSLRSHHNAGPFPPQHTGTRLYWNGSHAATAVIFAIFHVIPHH